MTKSIPNYICVKCGRGFSQKSSGMRHILNVEGGISELVTEADYRNAILTGTIPVPSPTLLAKGVHHLGKKREVSKKFSNIAYENYHSGFYRRLGEIAADNLPPPQRNAVLAGIIQLTEHIAKRQEKEEEEDDKAQSKILWDILRRMMGGTS